jgi:protein phosphatase
MFNGLFKKKSSGQGTLKANIQTTPLSEDQKVPVVNKSTPIHPVQLLAGAGQSNGLQRDHNEDTIVVISALVADDQNEMPFGIYIVADGMGGHIHGEAASKAAARVVARYLIQRVYYRLIDPIPEPMEKSLQETMEGAVYEAQKAVQRFAPGGGTTLTCAMILGEQVTIGHVGDSRAYFVYPDGRSQRLSQDPTLVQRMVDMEEITEQEALAHPSRNVLLRALGQSDPVRADIQTHMIPRGGSILLCSDGLWGVVTDAEMNQVVNSISDPSLACNKLVDLANKAGGPDNISVILVRYLGE